MKKLFFILVTVFLFNNVFVFAQYSNEYMRNKNEKISLDLNQDKMLNATSSLKKEKVININCNYREKNWWGKNKTTLIAASIATTIMSSFVGYIYYIDNYAPRPEIWVCVGQTDAGPAPSKH